MDFTQKSTLNLANHMGHRKAIISTFKYMRTSTLVDENEENFAFQSICMSEVSGNRNVHGILCARPKCSNYGTLLADYT